MQRRSGKKRPSRNVVERLSRNVCLIVYGPLKQIVNDVEWGLLVKDRIPKLQTTKPTFRKEVGKGIKDLAKFWEKKNLN